MEGVRDRGWSELVQHLPVSGDASTSSLVSRRTCGSLEIGTHTSVVTP